MCISGISAFWEMKNIPDHILAPDLTPYNIMLVYQPAVLIPHAGAAAERIRVSLSPAHPTGAVCFLENDKMADGGGAIRRRSQCPDIVSFQPFPAVFPPCPEQPEPFIFYPISSHHLFTLQDCVLCQPGFEHHFYPFGVPYDDPLYELPDQHWVGRHLAVFHAFDLFDDPVRQGRGGEGAFMTFSCFSLCISPPSAR